jgi:AraC-like DNA-binding protein
MASNKRERRSSKMQIRGFEDYTIERDGTIRNKRGRALKNFNGIIQLRKDGKAYGRSVPKLVWEHFKDEPASFVVTKDGSQNYHVDNLKPHTPGPRTVEYQRGEKVVDLPGEIWKPVPGFDGYEVSNKGRVRSYLANFTGTRMEEPRLKSFSSVNKGGYMSAPLMRNGEMVLRKLHHLVLEAFVGPRPEGMQTRHLDGNPANNCVENLAWGTAKENGEDRVRHGSSARSGNRRRGEQSANAILTNERVERIKERLAAGEHYVEVARTEGLHPAHVYSLGTGKSWRHIRPDLTRRTLTSVSGKVPDWVVDELKNGAAVYDLADKLDVSFSAITRKFQRVTGMTLTEYRKQNGMPQRQAGVA